jgi:quercetin dioxygenase-like cupin family protein
MITSDTNVQSIESGGLVPQSGFDLSTTHVHLGLGSRAMPIPDFEWSPAFLARYAAEHGADGDEGRLVMIGGGDSSWTSWERHPAGEEVVVVISGQLTLVQELDGAEHRIELAAGQAAINPRNVWHTADIAEPCQTLFITPGRGTEHRPR